ncbi:hypothetical protein H2200_009762 [Cladophialophora chaetospira]|uniref:MmgE/PrpD family protein n=1 Tax=Cladophialophora chaetospira TaxID=386627 RepID=A0AA38X311_9EURO|nr:hypothetical protein H2200_009762 [Cladophialophora chaetospira]
MHLAAGAHIGVIVIPAALALAQREAWSGETLLKAIVAGYDMAVALGSAVRSSGSCNPHFRPSGIIGAFAAAAVGIVADKHVDIATGSSALGLGANMTAGLNEWPWAGGMEINTQIGTASRSGIASLDLARAGISSSETVLEGRDGLFAAYGCGPDSAEVFRLWILSSAFGTGIMGSRFKPFAGCNFVQTPIAVALKLSNRLAGLLDQVEKIVIVTTAAAKVYPGCDSYGPFDRVQQTKMSLQYAVASALLFGRVDEDTYRRCGDHNLQALIQKCSIETDSEYDQELVKGRQPSRIEIIIDGERRYLDSFADVPWSEASAVEERFRREAAERFGCEDINNIVSACRRLPESTSCGPLFETLQAHKK